MTCHKFNKSGLTLLELLIALGIFGILTLTVSRIYVTVVDVQQRTIDEQSLEGDLSYAIDVLRQEAQEAAVMDADYRCSTSCDGFFCVSSERDRFCIKNNGVYVDYYLSNGQLVAERDSTSYTITSDDIVITSLEFLNGFKDKDTTDIAMDSVLVKVSAKSAADNERTIHYQTTITNTEFE